MNQMSWHMLNQFAAWIGARLPSEAEWEYAARNQGQEQRFPWGEERSCDYALFTECSEEFLPVCSRPEGNTTQDICDMIGSLWEWTQDEYYSDYHNAPNDGSGRCDGPCPTNSMSDNYSSEATQARVMRGGALFSSHPTPTVYYRITSRDTSRNRLRGGRLVRDLHFP